MKKIITIGGGTGLSTLIKGLKEFPVDITAIVAVSDDGRSTGILRREFNIPAVGDIRQVIAALSETEPLIQELINYRFKTSSDLNGHTLGNLLLTALIDVTGNLSKSLTSLEKILNLKGKILPLSEDNLVLMAEMDDGKIVEGEESITKYDGKIRKVFYKEKPNVLSSVIEEIKSSDLIVLSMGSLFTSIIPNLLCEEVVNAIDLSHSKILYVCNLFTQSGETDNFKASDHIKVLNSYLGKKKISGILINKQNLTELKNCSVLENQVVFDKINLEKQNLDIIADKFMEKKDNVIKHNALKLGLSIYSYLTMED